VPASVPSGLVKRKMSIGSNSGPAFWQRVEDPKGRRCLRPRLWLDSQPERPHLPLITTVAGQSVMVIFLRRSNFKIFLCVKSETHTG
jgi:hypothetical protein